MSTAVTGRAPHEHDLAASRGALIDGYRPLPGVRDEMMDETGAVRPHWQPVLDGLAALGPAEVGRRFQNADRYLRDSGVFYRLYDDAAGVERPWPLSHLPLVIDPQEWQALASGLAQRATLLERLFADIYGRGRLVAEGRLPAAAVAGSREFLRPLVGALPDNGAGLSLYAADLGRGPDGRWWVLADRTQAPSGAGYALENRITMGRALPELFEQLHVVRLAGFFQTLRAEMTALCRNADSRVCLLTPGPLNETYFEHAYLARYLGFVLVEGADLTVRGDTAHIRTIEGLERTDVLLRRLDSDWADPLELNPASRIGVPGLVQAVRAGNVTVVNALGSGVLESRALLGFVPALARHLVGRELEIPNVATWWCGQPLEREAVIADLDAFVIAPAFEPTLPPLLRNGPVVAAELDAPERAALIELVRRRGVDLVAHEAVKLSTTPVWHDGRLEPRPFVLRVFLARTRDGWAVMPGGLCRVADHIDARAVSMQRGGRATDVWVPSEAPVAPVTLLPAPGHVPIRRNVGPLTSRVADNLFWLGRYVERAEAALRLARLLAARAAERERRGTVTTRLIEELMLAWEVVDTPPGTVDLIRLAVRALNRHDTQGSILALALAARRAASVIRDRFSPEAWQALTDLEMLLSRTVPADVTGATVLTRINQALRTTASFAGLVQENMNQLAGWRFLEIGRRIERAINTCRFVRQFGIAGAPDEALDVLLELADSQITYRMRYVMVAARAPVLDTVVLDPSNPRSVMFQIERMRDHMAVLTARLVREPTSPPERLLLRLNAGIATLDATDIDVLDMVRAEQTLMDLSDAISDRWFTHRGEADDTP
ncbi:circularly permuted type 2 ATP-grasp protein [Blastochloris tepida]|uniref:circularly permuted type 2 ATP-grasp protein n=1 Tax=Blastochloris tepida TaxID=2233851 RepID=UPI001FCE7279|nr:circularly permuted type 2 ATP-grasp protein [Blastochloris tepida]